MPGGVDRFGPSGADELERDVGIENRLAARPVLNENGHVRTPRSQRLGRGEDRDAKLSGILGGAEPSAVAKRRDGAGKKHGPKNEGATQCSIPRMDIG